MTAYEEGGPAYVSIALLLTSSSATIALLLTAPGASADTLAPLLALSLVALGGLVWREYRRATLPVWSLLTVGGVLAVIAVARPPLGSHDMWSYAMYGRILAHYHANPYVHPPSQYAGDPVLRLVSPAWRNAPSIYGPGFALLSAAIMEVTRSSLLATRLAFQTTAAGALVLCGVGLARVGVPRWALAGLLLNPLVLVSAVNGGHNDVIVGAALLSAAVAIGRRRLVVGGLALAVAISVKAVAILSVLAAVAWVSRHHGRRAAALLGAIAVAPVGVGYLAFGGAQAVRPLIRGSHWTSRASMWSLLKHVPFVGGHVGVYALAAVAIVSVLLVRSRLDSPSPADVIAAGLIGYLVAGAYVLPWYLMWVLPVAAINTRPRTLLLVLAYSVGLVVAYVAQPVHHLDVLDRVLHVCIALTEAGVLVATAWIASTAVLRRRSVAI